MLRILFTLCYVAAVLGVSPPASASEIVDYKAFGREIRGFNNLSNTPPVPDVRLYDKSGNTVSLRAYKGKTLLVNFWATWCPPCIKEMPELNKLAATYGDRDFHVITIVNGRKNGREEPEAFLKKRNLDSLINLYDPDQAFLKLFDMNTLPLTFLIDPAGNMQGGAQGMLNWDSAKVHGALKKILK